MVHVHFAIAGDGPEKPRLVQLCADLPNVHFLPLQPEERLCELLNLANLHVLPQSRAAADLVLPSKRGGMLASSKLAAADAGTELFEVLSGTAILVPAGDSVAMAREIGILVAENKHPALGDGRKLARSFARAACLAKFCALLDATSDQDAGRGSVSRQGQRANLPQPPGQAALQPARQWVARQSTPFNLRFIQSSVARKLHRTISLRVDMVMTSRQGKGRVLGSRVAASIRERRRP